MYQLKKRKKKGYCLTFNCTHDHVFWRALSIILNQINALTHSLTPSTSVGHLWWLSRHAYFPCMSWFRQVFVRCPDTTDQHRSWLVFQHLFYHAQASKALDPTLLAQMILDSDQQIGGVSSWSYHSLWEDSHKAVRWICAPSN